MTTVRIVHKQSAIPGRVPTLDDLLPAELAVNIVDGKIYFKRIVGDQEEIRTIGETGDVGFTGPKGDVGFTGSRGNAGFIGSKGDVGFTGSKGDIGFTGSRGLTGSKGDTGLTGSLGRWVTGGGVRWVTGVHGITGIYRVYWSIDCWDRGPEQSFC